MAITHSLAESYKGAGGVVVTSTVQTFSADSESNIDEAVVGISTVFVALNLDKSNIVSILLYSDKALTVKTNSSSAPTDTIVLAAGVPRIWNTGHVAGDNPIQADVTAGFYLVNAAAVTANFKMRCLLNAS